MLKIFVATIFALYMVLSAIGCATQNTVRNYGHALTPAESAPLPIRSSRDESVYRSSKKCYCPICGHQVPWKYINTDIRAINTCPTCGANFPYLEGSPFDDEGEGGNSRNRNRLGYNTYYEKESWGRNWYSSTYFHVQSYSRSTSRVWGH